MVEGNGIAVHAFQGFGSGGSYTLAFVRAGELVPLNKADGLAVLVAAVLPYKSGWHPSGGSISGALLFSLWLLSSSSSRPEGGTECLPPPLVPLVLLILSVFAGIAFFLGERLQSKTKVGFESVLP